MEKIFKTSIKATTLSGILFLMFFMMNERFHLAYIPYVFVAFLFLFITCFIAILISIFPFYIFEKDKLSNDKIFKKYFPYYAILIFGICTYIIIISNFDYWAVEIVSVIFFTAIQSWIWFFKTDKNV